MGLEVSKGGGGDSGDSGSRETSKRPCEVPAGDIGRESERGVCGCWNRQGDPLGK